MIELDANVIRTAREMAPELILIAVAAILPLWGAFGPSGSSEALRRTGRKSLVMGGAGVIAAMIAYFGWPSAAEVDPARAAFFNDAMAQVLRPTGLIAGLGLLILASEQLHARFASEQIACLLLVVAGMNLAAMANDSIALFVSLELVSIPTYILLYLSRSDALALEATAKYFLLSIFSSAFVLYGLSIFLGCAGSTNFVWLRHSLAEPSGVVSVGMLQIGLAMTIAGLGFRIAAVPFHFYAPDVFQGVSTPVAGMLAVIPKIVGFAALLRLVWSTVLTADVHPGFSQLTALAPDALAMLAVATMTIGNVLALLQTDLRRLLAYSSVAHAGYMLVGLAVLPGAEQQFSGAQVVLFYLLVYSTMTLGVFGTFLMLRKHGKPIETIDQINGLGSVSPLLALVLAIFMFSLTGLPPTGGFWGKFNLFLAAWSTNSPSMRYLAIGLALNAAIAGWYYLRLVRRAYLRPSVETGSLTNEQPLLLGVVVGCCAIAIVGLFFAPDVLWRFVAVAS